MQTFLDQKAKLIHIANMIHSSTTPPTGRRQRNRERKHTAYLDHALAIVTEGGLDALTMPGLAERSDTAVGSLYRYFTGKEAIVAALQVRAVSAFVTHLLAEVGERNGIDAVQQISGTWASFRTAEPAQFGLADRSLSDPRQLLDDTQEAAVADALSPALSRVHGAIADAQADGTLTAGDPTLRTHALWAAMHGAEHFRKREQRSGINAETLRETLIAAILTGWGMLS
ncbi:MAG: AcrR family transcriptional regulator [Myxococcota bacterium]|jgi:AcrR family transcriptional regulator